MREGMYFFKSKPTYSPGGRVNDFWESGCLCLTLLCLGSQSEENGYIILL